MGVLMSSSRTVGPHYAEAVTEWLDFGSRYFHFLENPSHLGRFGPTSAGPLGIEATSLYAFVHGLAASDDTFDLNSCSLSHDECADRGLSAFRYCLHTHRAYPDEFPKEPAWGGTGMSPKMADQMALAAEVLDDFLEDQDREQLKRLIEHEADSNTLLPFHLEHVDHGFYRKRPPVPTERFGTSYPESNAWRACILARALLNDPDHDSADRWHEAMLTYLTNALSTPADAEDDTIVDGRPIRDWHAGANLHPSFALEHHGFFHPGYVNRALLSLASAAYAFEDAGAERPESLLRNVPEVWDVQRRLLLWDGALAYPAGDDYPRYCWGLLYLLPVLVFVQHELDDPVARRAELRLADLLRREQQANGDGSINALRLEAWRKAIEEGPDLAVPTRPAPSVYYRSQVDPAYYQALAYRWHQRREPVEPVSERQMDQELTEPFIEPDCGLVFHRSPERFAGWSWNAHRCGAQGVVLPREGDHLAEWEGNLISRFTVRGAPCNRRVLEHRESVFDGGCAASGRIAACDGAIEHQVGFAALPDGRTTVYLSRARTVRPVEMLLNEGMCLNIANDIFNDNARELSCEEAHYELPGPGCPREEMIINSHWINVDDMLGVVALDGQERFTLLIDGERRAAGHSLCYHELLHPSIKRTRKLYTEALIEDSALALLTAIDSEETACWSGRHIGPSLNTGQARVLTIRGANDTWFLVAIGYDSEEQELHMPLTMQAGGTELLVGEPEQFRLVGDGVVLSLSPSELLVAALAMND